MVCLCVHNSLTIHAILPQSPPNFNIKFIKSLPRDKDPKTIFGCRKDHRGGVLSKLAIITIMEDTTNLLYYNIILTNLFCFL